MLQRLIETLTGKQRRSHIELLRNRLIRSRHLELLRAASRRMRRRLTVHPRRIFVVDMKVGRGRRRQHRLRPRGPARKICERLPITRHICVQINNRRDALVHLLRHTRDHHPAIRVPHQHHVIQVLPLHLAHHIIDLRRQTNILRLQMRPLTDSRERRRHHVMTLRRQTIRHPPPAPSAMPCTMHQHKRAPPSVLSPRSNAGHSKLSSSSDSRHRQKLTS